MFWMARKIYLVIVLEDILWTNDFTKSFHQKNLMLIKVCEWKCCDLGLLYCLGLAVQHRISTLVLLETPWNCETLRRLKFSQKWALLQDPNYSSKAFKEWMGGKEGSEMGKSKLNLNPIKTLWDDLKWADSAYEGEKHLKTLHS